MNGFNVQDIIIPDDGVINRLSYRPGKFFNASLDKASEHNERQSIRITLPDGRHVGCVQIAGLVARRILCELIPEQRVDLIEKARQHERSEEHTSELQSLMRISYAVFCLKKKQYITPNMTN